MKKIPMVVRWASMAGKHRPLWQSTLQEADADIGSTAETDESDLALSTSQPGDEGFAGRNIDLSSNRIRPLQKST